jgi:transposase
MERDSLERWLAEGLSLEAIAKRVGKDPTTVGWWVRKHGLRAVHRDRHASRGGLERDWLTAQVESGASVRRIAEASGMSATTVRHWLRRFGLRTRAVANREAGRSGRDGGRGFVHLHCLKHGTTRFVLRGDGHYRCSRCRAEAVAARRRKVKETLVREHGGCCCVCGYARYTGALQFHHLDPAAKSYSLSERGISRSLGKAREEVAKCVLVCANCHAELEAGVTSLTGQASAAVGANFPA